MLGVSSPVRRTEGVFMFLKPRMAKLASPQSEAGFRCQISQPTDPMQSLSFAFLTRFPATAESLCVLRYGSRRMGTQIAITLQMFIAVHRVEIPNLVGQRMLFMTRHGVDIASFFPRLRFFRDSMCIHVSDRSPRGREEQSGHLLIRSKKGTTSSQTRNFGDASIHLIQLLCL